MIDRICEVVRVNAQAVVDSESTVRVRYSSDNDAYRILVVVPQDEVPQLIGRDGVLIKSIRSIVRAQATKYRMGRIYVDVDITSNTQLNLFD